MAARHRITEFRFTERFKKEVKRLPNDLQALLQDLFEDLLKNPIPPHRRFHRHGGSKNPAVYTAHLTPNHSHKISFELDGTVAILRRISTHKHIDRKP